MKTRKKGQKCAAAAKLDLFWGKKSDPFFVKKQLFVLTKKIGDIMTLYPFFEGLLELTSFQNSVDGGFLCGGKKAANLSICWLLQRHTSLSQFTTFFFFHVWRKKNDIKNNSSYNNFRRNEHRNAALFSKEAESLFFVINLPGAPFSKRCVARSFYLKC